MLGLVVVGGLTQVYLGGRDANRIVDHTTALNDNGRFAMEFFSRDLRMAGYFTCGGNSAHIANAVDIPTGTDTQKFWFKLPTDADSPPIPLGIEGFEDGDTLPIPLSTLHVKTGTDVFVIRYADVRNLIGVDAGSLDTGANTLTFDNPHYLNPGDIAVMNGANCGQTTFFQVTSAQDDTDGHYIGYGDSAGVGPGNCLPIPSGHYACAESPSLGYGIDNITQADVDGAVIAKFSARAFYVADDPGNCGEISPTCSALSDCPTLFIIGNETNSSLPVLRNVSDMQVEYGLDDDSSNEGVDDYYPADGTWTREDWLKVMSLRISVTTHTEECRTAKFSTTVAIRNAGNIVGTY